MDSCCVSQIRSRSNPDCYLCGSPGRPLYQGLQDTLFGVPGRWNFKLCSDVDCGLMWLDPMPVEEEIRKAYARYYTHAGTPTRQPALTRIARNAASYFLSLVNPLHEERERLALMHSDEVKRGTLLDVGCGSGARLARLRSLGWDVYGQDVDPVAVGYARETLGLNVHLGPLDEASFGEMF